MVLSSGGGGEAAPPKHLSFLSNIPTFTPPSSAGIYLVSADAIFPQIIMIEIGVWGRGAGPHTPEYTTD